jgi:hypothetical protein
MPSLSSSAVVSLAIAFSFSATACNNADHGSGDASASTEAGPGGMAGSDSGCIVSGPAITSAPAQWMRPADCGGIGDLCPDLGCGSQSECQLLGHYCVPSAGPNGLGEDCPQTPYCLGSSCMNYQQASCLCTGEAGVQMFPACACGPSAVVGLCAAEGASCAKTKCCNCQGLKCVTDSVSGTVCRQSCSQNTDCNTGCCDTSTGFCHDSLYCNCLNDGGTGCGGSGPQCCPGSTCLTYNSDGGGPFQCYVNCTQQAQCPAGTRCSQNIAGMSHGACGP